MLAIGPMVGVLADGPAAAYSSAPILVVLAVLPVALAGGLLVAGRPIGAAGVLVGAAFFAPGRALVDAQFFVDALVGSRPELAVPTSLAPVSGGAGAWMLIAGHVATIVAGALVVARAGAEPGTAVAAEFDEPSDAEAGQRKRLLGWGLAFGGLAALGLVMPAFTSDNAFLLSPDLMNGPQLVMAGGLLILVAAVFGSVFAGTTRTPKMGRGVLFGTGLGVLAVVLPAQVAGMTVEWLHTDWRTYLATFGALGLIGTAAWPSGYAPMRRSQEKSTDRDNVYRLHLAAGVLAILAGLAAIGGRAGELFVVEIPTDRPILQGDVPILLSGVSPETYANRVLLPAAILLILLGVGLLIRSIAAAVRPVLSVGWVAVPLAGMLALDAVVTATTTSGAIRAGSGTWWTIVAIVVALASAITAAVAGGMERDDVDLTERTTNSILMAPVAAAVLFAVGAFGLPSMRATDFVGPGIWSNFRLASWGLVLAMIAVIVAALLAPRSRPSKAAALLLGAAGVVGVHALEMPLTAARAADTSIGAGTWLSLACIAAFVISAFVAVVVRPEPVRRR